jgi:hypothetical protein
MAALAQRCQAVAGDAAAQPARIVSLNSLDKLNEDVDARASPVTVATGAAALERASTPPPSPPKTTTTYVEGAVSVLARCRSGPKLQWRPAAFSVDRVHGNLRIFRSDDERRAWHAHRHDNIAKFHLLIGEEHAVSPIINADAPPSPPRGRVRFRRVLADVREETSSDEGDESVSSLPPTPLSTRTERYCTFSVTKGGAPLLKFAAPPWRRRDLDALHGALAAVAGDVVVVPP